MHRFWKNKVMQLWDASMMADVPTFLFATRGQTHAKKLAKINTHYITNKHVACAASTANEFEQEQANKWNDQLVNQ